MLSDKTYIINIFSFIIMQLSLYKDKDIKLGTL